MNPKRDLLPSRCEALFGDPCGGRPYARWTFGRGWTHKGSLIVCEDHDRQLRETYDVIQPEAALEQVQPARQPDAIG